MAREKSFEERRKEREREDEEDQVEAPSLAARRGSTVKRPDMDLSGFGGGSTEKLTELFERVEPLIEQCNNLYNMYITGVESRPPLERRKHLDQVMTTLQMMAKPTQAYQFRFSTLNASYNTHKDRWDRMCKDLENGKIKRVTGPKARKG
jgi:hypothetical protein